MSNKTEYDRAFADRFWALWLTFLVPWGSVCFFWLGPGGVGESLRDYWKPTGLTDYTLLALLVLFLWSTGTILSAGTTLLFAEVTIASLHISDMQREAEEFFSEEAAESADRDLRTHTKQLGSLYGKCGCEVRRCGASRAAHLCRRHAYGSLHSTMKRLLKGQAHNINWDSE